MKNTISEYMTYRLNFVLWRARMVMQLLVTYFLWWAIFTDRQELFGYSQSRMLTYVLLSSVVRTVVLGTTTMEIGGLINRGNLSNFLIRPLRFFRYYMARDAADKALNVVCSFGEITVMIVLLRPQVFVQTNPSAIALSAIALMIGTVLYFYFSLLLEFLGFWTPDNWAPRFLSFVIMDFFAGGLFPLDILPQPLFLLSQTLPFAYFIYFPIKVYLGQLSYAFVIQGLLVGLLWVVGLWYLAQVVWKKGLRVYTAEGR